MSQAQDLSPTASSAELITGSYVINPAGAITGFYVDPNHVNHGFVRAPDGTITTFDAPGAVNGTAPSSIDPGGGDYGILPGREISGSRLRAGTSNGTFTTL